MTAGEERSLTLPPMRQVDADSVMDVEIASITQLTNSVQLAEPPPPPPPPPPNLLSPQLENDSDAAGMDLDGDNDNDDNNNNNNNNNDPSRDVPNARDTGIIPTRKKKKWDRDEIGTTHTGRRMVGDSDAGGWSPDSEYEVIVAGDGDGAVLESVESHEDDGDDSEEWLDGASVRADTQSIFGGDFDEDDEDDNEMLSGDEVFLRE